MSLTAEALRMADDPPRFFEYSNRRAHQQPREYVEEMQLAVLQQRFAQLRDRVAVLKAAADEQGIDDLADLEDGANLVFPDSVYKSYPVALLEKNRFDQMTKWLGRLTATDLSKADVRGCEGIDSWLEALEVAADVQVVNSSGTSGSMTFLPRTRKDYRIVSDIFGMTSRDFNEIESLPDLLNAPWHSFYLGFRGGRSHAGRAASWVIDNFAGSKRHFHALYDMDMSSDVMFTAARLRRAEARGELDRLQVSPKLKTRQADFEAIQKSTGQAMDLIFDKLIALKGQKVYIAGMTAALAELARRGLERGYRGMFGALCIVQCGGGSKGGKLAENWEESVLEFTGAKRIGQYYGMTEVTMITAKCSKGHYHVPPWIVPYVLEPQSGKCLPRSGTQSGRATFFDLVPQTYWGGIATGDEVTVDWNPCPCGRTSVHIHPTIRRFSEKTGADDKITCAAAEDAHAAAIDFLASTRSGSRS
jgi:hypothetical protein